MSLDPEAAAWLESRKGQPPRASLSVAQTREAYRGVRALGGEPPELARVEDLVVNQALRIRQYWPEADPSAPLLVYFHGGRFFSGDLETHDPLCRWLAAASGCRVAAVGYRLAPEHPCPAAVVDAVAAVDWAAGQASCIGVAGDSAGANLAAMAALLRRAMGLSCQLLLYPMLDPSCSTPSHREFAEGYGPGSADMARGWSEYLRGAHQWSSPIYAANLSGLPPAFVLTAGCDPLRDEGEAYAVRLRLSGNEVELRRYDGMIHGFLQMPGIFEAARVAIAEVGEFVRLKMREAALKAASPRRSGLTQDL